MGAILEVKVLSRADHSERSEAHQRHHQIEGCRMFSDDGFRIDSAQNAFDLSVACKKTDKGELAKTEYATT